MEQKIFCSNCGKENEPGAKFCVFCGSQVIASVVQQEEPIVEAVTDPAETVAEPAEAGGANDTYSQTVATATAQPQQYYSTESLKEDNGYKGVAIASLICGIVALLCCWCASCCGGFNILVAIAAVVLGIIALVKKFTGKGLAIAGIVCGGIAVVGTIIMLIAGNSLANAVYDITGADFEDALEEIYDDMGMDYDF